MQHIVAGFISEGYLVRHINRVRKFYGERMKETVKVLTQKYPQVVISGEHTGMHFVLKVPGTDVRGPAKKHHIISMSDYSRGENFNDTVLVGIGSQNTGEIVNILSDFLDEVLYTIAGSAQSFKRGRLYYSASLLMSLGGPKNFYLPACRSECRSVYRIIFVLLHRFHCR